MASFESFVAWRYLLTRERSVSRLAVIFFVLGGVVVVASFVGLFLSSWEKNPLDLSFGQLAQVRAGLSIARIAGSVLAGLALFFGGLRQRFTFFTVVPLGGVWIGTLALVCVLSVMSGFETDLRNKILGSNAHVQVTREDGDFIEWREVKAAIDKIDGVRGSTPFASSEVVIAANNNPVNVVIKGIDPSTIGSVTDLKKNLENDPDALDKLWPLVEDPLVAPPVPPSDAPLIDPAPEDLIEGGDPIDFSAPASAIAPEAPPPPREPTAPIDRAEPATKSGGAPGPSDGSDDPATGATGASGAPSGSTTGGSADASEPFGGDAVAVLGEQAAAPRDPPPADLDVPDSDPIDFSASSDGIGELDGHVHTIEVPLGSVTSEGRKASLPGVLIGRELAKQTNIATGHEVRVISPLSDPANPDATGTPIPFNRDYRVAGTFYTGMYEYDLKQVYVTLDSFQEFLDRGDAVDGIEVRVATPDAASTYVKRISAAIGPAYRVVDWTELNRSLFSALKLEKITMFIVLGIVILVASFSIVGNLIMVVYEKGREIALLKTLGATDWAIMRLFVLRGLMIGTIGTVLGVGMGLIACVVSERVGIPLNPDVYYIDRLPIHIDGSSVLLIAIAGVLISGLAALYPAVLAVRIRPATGMRH